MCIEEILARFQMLALASCTCHTQHAFAKLFSLACLGVPTWLSRYATLFFNHRLGFTRMLKWVGNFMLPVLCCLYFHLHARFIGQDQSAAQVRVRQYYKSDCDLAPIHTWKSTIKYLLCPGASLAEFLATLRPPKQSVWRTGRTRWNVCFLNLFIGCLLRNAFWRDYNRFNPG